MLVASMIDAYIVSKSGITLKIQHLCEDGVVAKAEDAVIAMKDG